MKYNSLADLTQRVKALQGKLHNCDGAWRCCNCLKDLVLCFANDLKAKQNNYSAQLRLGNCSLHCSTSYIHVVVALHHHSYTLYPVQLRILGLC